MKGPASENAGAGELYASLAPLGDVSLLLPNTAVSDVVGQNLLQPFANGSMAPEWLLGQITWSGFSVPAMSLEALIGLEAAEETRRSRLMVVKGLGESISHGHFAMQVSNHPHLVTLSEQAITANEAERNKDAEPWLLSIANLAGRQVWIPDILAIEQAIARELKKLG